MQAVEPRKETKKRKLKKILWGQTMYITCESAL